MNTLPQHPDDLADNSKSGYRYVQRCDGPPRRPHYFYQAIVRRGRASQGTLRTEFLGPKRRTSLEAAWDYIRHVNGKQPQVHTASGRPDFMKDEAGKLHVDLPAASNVSPQRPKARRESKERALIERMTPRVNAILGPNDIAEAKATCGRQAICTAVGQLLMRRFETGKGRMFIVLPEQPCEKDAKFLRHHNITLIVEGS